MLRYQFLSTVVLTDHIRTSSGVKFVHGYCIFIYITNRHCAATSHNRYFSQMLFYAVALPGSGKIQYHFWFSQRLPIMGERSTEVHDWDALIRTLAANANGVTFAKDSFAGNSQSLTGTLHWYSHHNLCFPFLRLSSEMWFESWFPPPVGHVRSSVACKGVL